MKINERKGGWQVNVEYFDDYVIKTPKTDSEMRETISRYLNHIGKPEQLDKRVKDMVEGWKNGIRILSEKKLPSEFLGNIEFLDKGKIKQKKVIVLEDLWNAQVDEGKINEMKGIVDQEIDFIIELWKYGIHEKTGKVGYEFGLMDDKIILIDFGEICADKTIAEKQISKKYWEKHLKEYCRKEVVEYFESVANKKLTIKNLNNFWNMKNKI